MTEFKRPGVEPGTIWCEHCRDHFDRDHYGNDTEGWGHKSGREYGLVGTQLAYVEELETALKEIAQIYGTCTAHMTRDIANEALRVADE